jgi:DNA-binding NtrC family response regulator
VAQTRTVEWVSSAAGLLQAMRVPAYSLRVVKGSDLRKERRIVLSRARLGSAPGVDFQLSDPTVSSLHCEILLDAEGCRVRDLGAKNGLRVGGRRVTEAWLEAKEDLALGESVVRFRLLGESEERALPGRTSFGRLRGASARMQELYSQLAAAAASDANVLIEGETGSGKELAAESLFSEGPRRDRPFGVVDCGRLTDALAESELFGHEKGAFTGAAERHIGAFEAAHGGTLFLDEIGELRMDLQPKLLRVLEQKTVQRVGGDKLLPVDVRVIAATNRELEREVNRGNFRADLFYRLAVVELIVPALREHPEDIPELVAHFLQELPHARELPPNVLQRILQAEYPGNVRQLRNAVERAVLGLEQETRPASPLEVSLELPFRVQKERVVASFERAYIAKLLDACKGNVSEAARRSGMNRAHLYEVLQRLRLDTR